MVNMKVKQEPMEVEQSGYPYGLCIHLGKEELNKLGIDKLPEAGSTVSINAVATVKGVFYSQSEEGEIQRSMDLQITDIEIGEAKEPEQDIAKSIYGKPSNGVKPPDGTKVISTGYF